MKRYFLLIACALLSITSFAQEPNRLLVRDKMGTLTPFHIDRIDSVYFGKVEGRVAADITIKNVTIKNAAEGTVDMVELAIKRTEPCAAYKVACIKKSTADMITDDTWAVSYFAQDYHSMYYGDYESAQMTNFDFEFTPEAEYCILTLGYDQYGTPCEMQKAMFTTPKLELVGSPTVAYEETSVTTDVVTLTFKPNSDVGGFAACLFSKGQAESQYNMFGAWMGFSCMGDMIKSWGYQGGSQDTTFTWTGQAPNTEYEIYVQCWDVNGTYADMIIIPILTKKLGGEGTAEVAIEIKESTYYEEYKAFTQRVIFTPNENVSLYRAALFDYKFYEEVGKDSIVNYLKTDNPRDPYWDLYKTDDGAWELDPSTKYIAAAIAKNSNDEWGPVNIVEFSTPATADVVVPATSAAPAISKAAPFKGAPIRIKKAETAKALKGVSPYASATLKKGLQLTGK